MKTKILAIAVVAFIFSLIPLDAHATDTSASAGVDIMNQYVWRGISLGDNKGVAQPSVTTSYGPVSVNLWANYDEDTGENTETDLTLSYSRSMDKMSIEVGLIYYALNGAKDTQEIYLSVGYDTILSPNITIYHDIEEADGSFIVLSVGHEIELTEGIALNLGASASVNINNTYSMGTDANGEDFVGLYNGEVTLSLPVALPMDNNIVIEPKLAYSFALSNDADDAISNLSFDGDSSVLYAGLGLSVSF